MRSAASVSRPSLPGRRRLLAAAALAGVTGLTVSAFPGRALAAEAMLSIGRSQRGDMVVVVAGSPPGTVGSTNLIRVHRLGEEDHV